jgi:trimethyllysine dioxygenase
MGEGGERAVGKWAKSLLSCGIAVITGVPSSVSATEQAIRRIGPVREIGAFGGVWSFTSDQAKADLAYTSGALSLHTDGTYLEASPGVELFHHLEVATVGGRLLVRDGFDAARRLFQRDRGAFDLLSTIKVTGMYRGDGLVMAAAAPVIEVDHRLPRHPDGCPRLVQIRFNNEDRSSVDLPLERMDEYMRALKLWMALLTEEGVERIKLGPGTLIALNNKRVLHGREAFSGGRRMVCGAYMDKDIVDSRARTALIAEKGHLED